MKRFKLTPSQEAMLLQSLADPSCYTTVLKYTLSAPIDPVTVARRIQLLAHRHEALKTTFIRDDDGVFWQQVTDQIDEKLFRFELNGNELTVTFHHALLDGWSIGVIMRELLAGDEPCGKVSPFRYYVKWLDSRNYAEALDWWKAYLKGGHICSELPGMTKPGGYERRELRFGIENSEVLRSVARVLQITPGRLIEAVWCLLVARYNGGKSIVCIINSGRSAPVPRVADMVGMCVNTIPIVTCLPKPPESIIFSDWIRTWSRQTAEAEKNSFCALGDIISGAMPHVLSIEPPFDGSGYLLKSSTAALVTDFDAVFMLSDDIRGEFAYNACAYSDESVSAIQEHFLTALNAVLDNPQIALELIPILTSAKISELTVFNENRELLDIIECQTVADFWLESARQYSTHEALVCGDIRLTYAQVAETVDRLSAALRTRGVGTETPVAILLPRSERYVIAELAVMLAGGMFVPLDTGWPDARIQTILAETKPLLVIDDDIYSELVMSAQYSASGVSPHCRDAAYMIMTSGTTGIPKGVVVEHRSLAHFCLWAKKRYGWRAGDSSALELGFAFDGSMWSIWPALISGGTLHILRDDVRYNISALGDYCSGERITHIDLPVTMAEAFREIYNGESTLPDLRVMVTGGEEVRRIIDAPYPLSNEYGPTECTVCCSAAWVSDCDSPITIGAPLPNMNAYILDEWGRLCPDGVTGEACFAGIQVARGYRGAPELTAERFTANPFAGGKDNHNTMYRTGDLMKWTRRGELRELVFAGRADNQVKLNGFRIELGEIESVLLSHNSVATAVAAVKENKQLCAYVVPRSTADISELDALVASKLPAYMLPTLVLTDNIPLNSSGKVDLDRLPSPDTHNRCERIRPVTEQEKVLVAAVSRTLDIKDIWINDSYIALGGNSISAMRIAFYLEREGWTLAAKDLIVSGTLAEAAGNMRPSTPANNTGQITDRIVHKAFTPLPAQQAMMLLTETEGADIYAVTLKLNAMGLSEEELRNRMEKAAALHDILRTTFEISEDGNVYGHVHNVNDLPRPVVDCVLSGGELTAHYHHISLDGYSVNLLINELLYNQFPDTAPSFAKFAERLMADDGRRAEDEAWWRERCRNAVTVSLLPSKSELAAEFERIEAYPPELLTKCTIAARNARVTPAAFMLTAWGITVSTLGAENDILLPFVASCRDNELLMGMCAATLPLVFQMSRGCFSELARRTQDAMLESTGHWFVPQDIVGRLPRYLFVFEDGGGLAASGKQNYDLVVKFSNSAELIYNTACLPETDAQNLAARLNAALTAAVDDRISVFREGEYKLVTRTFALGQRLTVTYKTAVEAFRAAAERYAGHIALETDAGVLTYAELLEQSELYSHALSKQGYKAGNVVDFCLPRNAKAITRHLGIMLSGAAFLPLDPEWPEDRRAGILSEIQQAEMPTDTAYVLYTSGTTGKPKGVVIPQSALANQIAWAISEFEFNATDKILHYVSFTFDPSVWTVFASLCSGATLSLISEHTRLNPDAVARTIREKGITVCVLPAAVGVDILRRVGKSKLRLVFLGGEAIKDLPTENRDYEVINCYGPTEACVNAAFYRLPSGETETRNIGKPVANTECYVLDSQSEPCPAGIQGELYIGGVQLAHGYLNRPEESAAAFTEHPDFGRLYRTGDRAVWNTDGTLTFLGRRDSQVKIRGNRVELSEIEHALCDIHNVSAAKVRLSDDGIDAYIVSSQNVPPDTSDMRITLSKRLPSYMLPRSITVLDAFPLTENGKVDYAAFPEPVRAAVPETGELLSETEQSVADAWKTSLGLPPAYVISRGDSFNDLGGHSLLLFHLVGILAASGITADIKTLIEHPILEDLANALNQRTYKHMPKVFPSSAADSERYLSYVQRLGELDLSAKRTFNHILITGGTGFLGSHLVREFYRNTDAVMYLPVRGDTGKLCASLKYYFGASGAEMFTSNRIRTYISDISEASLDTVAPPAISSPLDAIFHAAADIRHYAPEHEMYKANVTATENMLTLAAHHPEALFVHISTTSAVNSPTIYETDTDLGPPFENIYQRTKQLAEECVRNAGRSGMKYAVFRVGHVSPGYEHGSIARNWEINAMLRLINAMLLTGLLPEQDYKIGYGYVDKIAASLRLLSTPVNLEGHVFHIDNPNSLRLSELFKLAGLSGEVLPGCELTARLRQLSASDDKQIRLASAEYLGRLSQGNLEKDSSDIVQGMLKMDATLLLLRRLGFEWPLLTARYMQSIIRSLKEGGMA